MTRIIGVGVVVVIGILFFLFLSWVNDWTTAEAGDFFLQIGLFVFLPLGLIVGGIIANVKGR